MRTSWVPHGCVLFALGLFGQEVRAGTIHVPADQPTIQAAIDAAHVGDVVEVAPGIYRENIVFPGKAITVESAEGPTSTTIDGDRKKAVVTFAGGERPATVLSGFTIRNGRADLGGGIFCSFGSPTITNNIITGNIANDSGGGVYVEGSLASPLITDNVIARNLATDGAGVAVSFLATPILVNNTLVENLASGQGGGLLIEIASSAIVANCVLWDDDAEEIFVDLGSSLSIDHSDIEGGAAGTGNIDADPLFVDAENGDFHLSSGSPCIDAASNSAPGLPAIDFDGDPRILGVNADIGADEAHPAVRSIVPARERYNQPFGATLSGSLFTSGSGMQVFFGGAAASNVVVVDDQTLTCDVPPGEPGAVDVVVSNSIGSGVLASGFIYTPAIQILGAQQVGSSITIRYLNDPLDGLFAIAGLPPQQNIPTPPYHGDLCILPFHVLFYFPSWPSDHIDLVADIPDNPSLSGVQVLFQALIGQSLAKSPKEGAWTNCAVLAIE